MQHSAVRRFTLPDAIVLLMALAAGLALVRRIDDSWWLDVNCFLVLYRIHALRFTHADISLLTQVLVGFSPLLATWTFALWMLRLVPPRPGPAELFRQPGFVATHAATLTLVLGTLLVGFGVRRNGTPLLDLAIQHLPIATGLAVVASWLILALTRQWQAEPTWIERFGVLAGLGWAFLLLMYALAWVL